MLMDQDVVMESNPGLSTSSSDTSLSSTEEGSLTENMKVISTVQAWELCMERATPDLLRKYLIPGVLLHLTHELSKTSASRKFIPQPSLDESEQMVINFSEEGLNDWRSGMLKGVKENDWTALIKLVKRAPNVAPGVPIELQNAVIRAWNQEYHGDAHKVLIRSMDELHNLALSRNYAKILLIAQSSGTGKSKTVEMAGKERILLPLCLREELGDKAFAYPPTDRVVRTYFESAPNTEEEANCKQHFRNFLSAIFRFADHLAQEFFPENEKTSFVSMAEAFHKFFSDPVRRSDFYDDVVAKAEVEGSNPNTVWEGFRQLITRLKQRCSDWPDTKVICPIFISVDEVHVLYTDPKRFAQSTHSLYARFKSVLNEGVSYAFGVICMSTTSDIAGIAPSQDVAPSLREQYQDRILPAPFTELPFDVFLIAHPLIPGKEDLYSVGTFPFTARFGRPLFYATYLSREKEMMTLATLATLTRTQNRAVEDIMKIIQQKLSGRSWPPTATAKLDASSIAILSARLLLDLSPAIVSARRFETELVRTHLRLLYSVHRDRATIVTGFSPEPLISEAAARFMHHSLDDGTPYMNFWGLLEKYVEHGLAAQGDIGELIGRALSISAMDHVISNLPDGDVRELKYQTPVRVTDYYKAFLTPEAWESLRQSIPANHSKLSNASGKKSFEDAFTDAYFHFSHYGKANDTSPIQDSAAWAYWLRGTAILCQLNQDLTDRMIPMYFPKHGGLSPKSISANLDQDKTGEKMKPANVAIQSAEALCIFSPGNGLPYISAVHCYALTENQGISVTGPPKGNARYKVADEEAPRYQIDFRGLASYANLTNGQKVMIQGLINRSKNAVFENHPRKYGVTSLRRMLPLLGKDPASTEWFGGYEQASQWNQNPQ